MSMTHFKKRKITKREVSEFLGFNLFSNVPLDYVQHFHVSAVKQFCKIHEFGAEKGVLSGPTA